MEALLFISFVVAIFFGIFQWMRTKERRRELARELGLTFDDKRTMSGPWQGCRVEVSFDEGDSNAYKVEMIHPDAPAAVSLRKQGGFNQLRKLIGEPDVELGDDRFDSAFFIGGPLPWALASLPDDARARLLGLAEANRMLPLRLEQGTLSCTYAHQGFSMPPVEQRLHAMKGALDAMVWVHNDLTEQLAARATREPSTAIRRKIVARLAAQQASEARTRAMTAALTDADAEVRVSAAVGLAGRPDARAALVGIVKSRRTPDALRVRAATLLGGRAYPDGVDTLRGWLADGDDGLRRVAVRALDELGLADELDAMQGGLAVAPAADDASGGLGVPEGAAGDVALADRENALHERRTERAESFVDDGL